MFGVAFLPGPFGFLAWVAWVPLLFALDARIRAGASAASLFRLGYLQGLAFFLIGTNWIAHLSSVAITVPWLRFPAWIAAAAYLALFGGLIALAAGLWARRFPLALGFPFAVLAVEELRASGEMGFPWFQAGYSQHAYAPLIQLASLGSVTLVTLWLAALNGLLWTALRRPGVRLRAAFGAALMLALPWAWGTRVLDAAPRSPGPIVALVQANIPGEIKWSGKYQNAILRRFLELSERGAAAHATLVIWPETATGTYMRKQLDQALAVADFAHRSRTPVLAGFADYDFGPDGKPRSYNAAGRFSPNGETGRIYAKQHLVPFGERMPFQRWLPAMGRIQLGQAEWTPGNGTVLFPSVAGNFGCLICFESIFPSLTREAVRSGARWMVNLTNDEWFGDSPAIDQHAAMAQFRAVENHVPIARCANTGRTELIDACGRVRASLPTFRSDVLIAPLGAPWYPTPYTRAGDWPGILAALVLLAGAGVALTRRAVAA